MNLFPEQIETPQFAPRGRWKGDGDEEEAADGRKRQVNLEISNEAERSAKSDDREELCGTNQKQQEAVHIL